MKKFFKNNWQYLLTMFVALLAIGALIYGINYNNLRADSGWDSGGSSSSSSSSSSSYDSHSNDGYQLNQKQAFKDELIFLAISSPFIILLIWSMHKRIEIEYKKIKKYMVDLSDEEIQKYLPNETSESLKKMIEEKFIAIQYAWMEFDYDKLRELCTDELCNMYIDQLEVLKLKNGKNIMSDFMQPFAKIINIYESGGYITIVSYFKIAFKDYVINTKTNKVIRGKKKIIIGSAYELQFVVKKNKDRKVDSCPNCGAKIKAVNSTKCEYCGSTIVVDANDYVLSKKTIINNY